MKHKIKRKKKIIPISPSTEEFYDEAPFDEESGLLHITDLGNAWRFVEHTGDVVYNCNSAKWLNWDGRRWNEKTGNGYVWRKAEKIAKNIMNEISKLDSDSIKRKLITKALISQKKNSIDNMVKIAQHRTQFERFASDFDKDPWLFNCLNGTLDLRKGKLREHRQEDMITKLCPVEYDEFINDSDNPNKCELWYKFLNDITNGDKAIQRFLQQIAGLCLTGIVIEELFIFIYGKTATGKTTFIEALAAMMGDYAIIASFETFLRRQRIGEARPDIARLTGARAVFANETDKGKRLSEGLIKQITGGDSISARFLYKEEFTYKPQFTLILSANDAPKISDRDTAMWRRVLRVPFDHYIPKNKQDPKVKIKLSNPKIAGATILFWAVQGHKDWAKNNLQTPPAVEKSTREYRREMNPLKTFFEDCCIFSEAVWTYRAYPYTRYLEHHKESGYRIPLSQRDFNERLEALGCYRARKIVKKRLIKIWKGIKIRD